ncbi:DUF2147 domain-containing protein [Methylotenera sp. N17]|jgi:uncharacterized protein (DUF2147 family)|uniref:DUF2147 domain-containing protein n=1 Tax=Methylotenera sp. N17 TaxID=1502761 RepID=UPI000646AE5C|nr:DUF2147 domain-containing protein [Methylotenera sp. N17]
MRKLSVIGVMLSMFLLAPLAWADTTPVGLWKTIDDTTGKPRSLIRISENNGEYSAVVEKGLRETDTGEAVCDKCTDERKGQKIIGMTIAKGLKKNGTKYDGGEILDPESGKLYKCKMTLDESGNKLEVRGYIGIALIGRSQTWHRVE